MNKNTRLIGFLMHFSITVLIFARRLHQKLADPGGAVRRSSYLVALLAMCFTLPVQASREFVLDRDGQTVTGGEVCFYRTAADVARMSPDQVWLHERKVRCLPSDTLIDFPAGRFYVFGRHPDGLVSAHGVLLYFAEPSTADCSATVRIPLQPAATLTFERLLPAIPDDQYPGVWIADTRTTVGMFLPLIPGERTIRVPANTDLVPLLIQGKQIHRIGKRTSLRAGEAREADFTSKPGTGEIVAWLDTKLSAVERRTASRPPHVVAITSSGQEIAPLVAPQHPQALEGELLLFRDLPQGSVSVVASDEMWSADRVQVDLQTGGATTISRGLHPAPAGILTVTLPDWFVQQATTAAAPCRHPSGEGRAAAVEISSCSQAGSECTVVASVAVSVEEPAITRLTAIPPGTYSVRLQPGDLTASSEVTVEAFRETALSPQFAGSVITGHVRKGESPLRGWITFPTADSAMSDTSGQYSVLLRRDSGRLPIRVVPCDETAMAVFIPDEAPKPGKDFDIVIPDNAVRLHVFEAGSRKPIAQARVTISPPPAPDGAVSFSVGDFTSEQGDSQFRYVPSRESLVLCARAHGYRRACTNPFTMPVEGEVSREIALVPESRKKGRVRSQEPLAAGRVYIADSNGRVVANAVIAADGSFEYEELPPLATAVVVSSSHPLVPIGPIHPPPPGEDLLLDLAKSAARTFTVSLDAASGRTAGRVGLAVGGLTIPTDAFLAHQALYGEQIEVTRGKSIVVRNVADLGDIVVYLGPDPADKAFPPDAVSRADYRGGFPSLVLTRAASSTVFR
jgi:hypothetical protein